MRKSDLARSAFGGLWRQKGRTMLTLTGVMVGACSLAFSASLGIGLRAMIDREFQKRDEFWWIRVYTPQRGTAKEDDADIPPDAIAVEGNLPEEAKVRIRNVKIEEYRQRTPPKNPKLITPELVEQIRAIPDVEEIRTSRQGYALYSFHDRITHGMVYAGRLDIYDPPLDSRLIYGRMPADSDANECIVSEYSLYKLGVRNETGLRNAIGQPLSITLGSSDLERGFSLAGALGPNNPLEMVSPSQAAVLNKIVQQFPDKIDAFDLHPLEKAAVKAVMTRKSDPNSKERKSARASPIIVGVVRMTSKAERQFEPLPARIRDYNTDAFLAPGPGEQFFGQLRETIERGYPEISVRCRPNGDLRGVVNAIESLGVEQFSTLKWYESAKLEVTLISVGLNVFALVAMFIAAVGITNTLVQSVLERTREIGILKAVGAKDGDVSAVFLAEGAAVGVLGGILGVVVARLIAGPADTLVNDLVRKVSQQKMITQSVFDFPWWLCGGAILFAVLVTTLAAWYPARRAARIEPVDALRHE